MNRMHFFLCSCFCLFLAVSPTIWSADPVELPGWPVDVGDRPFLASICLADVDGDNVQDVIAGTYGEEPDVYGDGLICIWDGSGVSLPGWPQVTSGPVPGTPSVADLDGDGEVEIIAGSWSNLYVFDQDGSSHPGWPLSYSVTNTTAIANMDGDADLEIVFVSSGVVRIADHTGAIIASRSLGGNLSNPAVGDIDEDGDMEVVVQASNLLVYMLESDLTDSTGWPQSVIGETWMNNRAPALGDLDGDGKLEILSDVGGDLYVFSYDGTVMPGWPQAVYEYGNNMPICLDMDGNGDLEVLTAKSGTFEDNIYVFEHDGSPFGTWPLDPGMQPQASPSVGDIDADAAMELVVNMSDYVAAYNDDVTAVIGWPVALSDYAHSGTVNPAQAIGDVNGDGLVDVVAASNFKYVAAYTVNEPYNSSTMEWPMFAHNARHTGAYSPPGLSGTISCSLSCSPPSGTLPFSAHFAVTVTNLYTGYARRVRANIDVQTGGGLSLPNWKVGTIVLGPGESYTPGFNQMLPARPTVVGTNAFTLFAVDVTPSPYNQPPYPPSGDSDSDGCTVVGVAP